MYMCVGVCVCVWVYVKPTLSKDFPWVVNTGCWKEREMGEWILDNEDLGRLDIFTFRRWIIKSLSIFIPILNLYFCKFCLYVSLQKKIVRVSKKDTGKIETIRYSKEINRFFVDGVFIFISLSFLFTIIEIIFTSLM